MIDWQRARGPVMGALLVVAVGVPVVRYAVQERTRERAAAAHYDEVMKSLAPLAPHAGEGRRVFINGDPIYFRMQTTTDSVAAALDGVTRDCESGDASRMLGIPGTGERTPRAEPLGLTKILRQDDQGVASALCIFHRGAGRGEGTAQTRYTVAHENDDHRVSLFTIATEQAADAFAVFPEEGDAPGGDFAAIPRPRDTRRLFAATIEGSDYAVRIYEARAKVPEMVQRYDEDVALAGWVRSASVAREMPETRFYTRGEERFVANFEQDGEAARVSIAPFSK